MPFCACPQIVHSLMGLWMFCICINMEYASIRVWRQRQHWSICLFSFVAFVAASFFLRHICGTILHIVRIQPLTHFDFTPLWVLVDFATLFMGISIFLTHYVFIWQKTHISKVSLHKYLDCMPVGICYYLENGMPELFNEEMERLSFACIGKPLRNAAVFWEKLQDGTVEKKCKVLQTGQNPLLVLPDGKVISFTRRPVDLQYGAAYELIATDMTEEHERAELLRRENEELELLNARLRRYGEQVTEVTREREILDANMRIHDKMNWLLLSTRHCIEDGCTDEKRAQLLSLWENNVLVFCRTEPAGMSQNPVQDIEKAAASIGLGFRLEGTMPRNKAHLHVVMLAAAECLTNAARHVQAKTMFMHAEEGVVEFTDDGKGDCESVQEGGGLKAIRRSVENVGGRMEIDLRDGYCLRLCFPRERDG